MKRFIVFSLAICALIVGMTSVAFAGTQSLQKEHGLLALSENNLELPDSDELLTEFIEKHASAEAMGEQVVKSKKTRGARLTGNEAIVYEAARKGAEKIASGESDSAKIEVPISDMLGGKLEYRAADLGLDTLLDDNDQLSDEACDALYELFDFDESKVLAALIYDTPYDFYWFNKTKGYSISLNFRQYTAKYKDGEYVIGFDNKNPAWELGFIVSKDYSKYGKVETVDVDTKKTKAAATAALTAGSIVKKAADKTDLQKLTAYKDMVCNLAEYNVDAATDDRIEYGNPWQLIYVFDGDETTNVVCEGYTKAFQFLCDLTEFESAIIKSHMVTGMMVGGTGEGGHMWNIVHMDDGKNYLVDVTNCDEDTIGAPDLLFLKGYEKGSVNNGYTYKCNDDSVFYQYDSQTKGLFDNDELTLSDEDYKEAACDHDLKKTDAKQATCTSDGNTAYWKCGKCGRYFCDAEGKNEVDEGDWVVKGGHDYGKLIEKVPATCTKDGMEAHYECSRCHKLFVKDKDKYVEKTASDLLIAKLTHSIKYVPMKKATATASGNIEYWTCTGCGTCYSDEEGETVIDKEDTVIPVNDFKVAVKKKLYSAKFKKKTTIKGTALYKVTNNKGKVTYKKSAGKSKFSVSKKNGNIVVKKGLKKGVYVVKVKVTTAATEEYTACTKTVSVKIKVK